MRIRCAALLIAAASLAAALPVLAGDWLPSWNEGAAKQAVIRFVHVTTDPASAQFVPPSSRIATFDQDGTLWSEQPMYSQLVYCLDRVPELVQQRPALADTEPYRTVLSGDRAAIAALPGDQLLKLVGAALSGMSIEDFQGGVTRWLTGARDPRWHRPYTELVYQPMLELLKYLRANGYKTYIVTGGGQEFVRAYSERVYGIPPEQVIGSAGSTSFGYDASGQPLLTKNAKSLLVDDGAGKPEGIQLMIGRRPYAAFGNSDGDRQMLQYVSAGTGARLALVVLHDDAQREYAYGPARGLPATKVGAFSQGLYDEAQKHGWVVVSMQHDWKRVFAFDE